MLHYFKDEHGKLHAVSGELDISDQRRARHIIEMETNMRVKTAILTLAVDNPPLDEPMLV